MATAEAYRVPAILVFNKIDLYNEEEQELLDAVINLYQTIGYRCIKVSAVTGEGINALKSLLYEKGFGGDRAEDAAFLVEERHFDALNRANAHINQAIFSCATQPLDLIGNDVKAAWDALGEITGETATEAIIEEIFSKFCVGK